MVSFDKSSVFVRTSEILQKHLPSGLYAEDFSAEHTKVLTVELIKYFKLEDVLECKDEVRRAIKEYFSDTHDELIVVFHKDSEIIIREKNALSKKKFNRLVLKSIQKYLTYEESPFEQDINSGVCRLDEIKVNSFNSLLEVDNEKLFKKVLRESTKRFLHLEDEDQVVFLNNSLFVKKASKKTSERRLLAFPKEEFFKIQNRYFNFDILPLIEEKLLLNIPISIDFTKISNQKFSKIYIKTFHNVIYDVVSPILENEDEPVVKHFTNFMLRKYFDEMMIICAEELSYLVLQHNMNAEKFLLYYNGGLIATAEKKTFVKPLILHEDGNEYKMNELLSTIIRFEIVNSKTKNQEKAIVIAKNSSINLEEHKKSLEKRQYEHVSKLTEFKNISKSILKSIARRKEHQSGINKKLLSSEELSVIERKELFELNSVKLHKDIQKYKHNRKKVKEDLQNEQSKFEVLKHELVPLKKNYLISMKAIARAMAKKLEPVSVKDK